MTGAPHKRDYIRLSFTDCHYVQQDLNARTYKTLSLTRPSQGTNNPPISSHTRDWNILGTPSEDWKAPLKLCMS
jgi:hypothetical protein